MRKYSFLFEADQVNLENPSDNNGFEPLIKSKADIPLSLDQAKKMEIVAKIREIEAKTKESEAKAQQLQAGGDGMDGGDPSMGGGIDPATGMPMDPSMGGAGGMPGGQIDPNTGMPMDPSMGGGIDPMTGMPMDPNQQQNDPLMGLGDKSAPPDPMGGMGGGGMDPMTGMPSPSGPTTAYTAIGRAYKLKQIFEYLLKIKKYLRDNTSSETNLEGLYDEIHQAYEMFKLVINNLKIYKDQVDDLIIKYYELIKLVLEKINNNLNEGELNDILDTEDVLSDDEDEDDESD